MSLSRVFRALTPFPTRYRFDTRKLGCQFLPSRVGNQLCLDAWRWSSVVSGRAFRSMGAALVLVGGTPDSRLMVVSLSTGPVGVFMGMTLYHHSS